MTELTTHTACACDTNREWSTTVLSSDGVTEYTVRWGLLVEPRAMTEYGYTCTCPGFVHHGSCKHVRALEEQDITRNDNPRCGWDSRWDAGEVTEDRRCHCCGGSTYIYTYGA